MLQVGARNMQNFALLSELGRVQRPVLLKRGLSATVKELLMAAEYIMAMEIRMSSCASAAFELLKRRREIHSISRLYPC